MQKKKPAPGKSPNPAELRMILGNNLRYLAAEAESISGICRSIGVNRTQFNRYLSGSAFPRPDVLYKICNYFGVDANIVLHPLDEIRAKLPLSVSDVVAENNERPFDHYLLPDGIYVYWRKSFRTPFLAYQGMALIKTDGKTKRWKGYDTHRSPIRQGETSRYSRSSGYEGRLFQQFDGFALVSKTPYSDLMNITYFEYGLNHLPDYFSGISFITRRRVPEANRLTATVMKRLPNSCSELIKIARKCGTHEMSEVSAEVRETLMRVPDYL